MLMISASAVICQDETDRKQEWDIVTNAVGNGKKVIYGRYYTVSRRTPDKKVWPKVKFGVVFVNLYLLLLETALENLDLYVYQEETLEDLDLDSDLEEGPVY